MLFGQNERIPSLSAVPDLKKTSRNSRESVFVIICPNWDPDPSFFAQKNYHFLQSFLSSLFILILVVYPDPYSDYGSGFTQFLITEFGIWNWIHITGLDPCSEKHDTNCRAFFTGAGDDFSCFYFVQPLIKLLRLRTKKSRAESGSRPKKDRLHHPQRLLTCS